MQATTEAPDKIKRIKSATSELLHTEQAAAFLGLSEKTLNNDRCTRKIGIPFVKIGRSIKYRRSDLEKFISDRVVC